MLSYSRATCKYRVFKKSSYYDETRSVLLGGDRDGLTKVDLFYDNAHTSWVHAMTMKDTLK